MSHRFFPHQNDALAYAKPRQTIALFMEMRLGKSSVLIRWTQHRHLKRVLLLAPLTTLKGKSQWTGELVREGISPVVLLPRIPKKNWRRTLQRTDLIPEIVPAFRDDGFSRPPYDTTRQWRIHTRCRSGWVLVNFEALLHRPWVLDQPWDAIIIDESTRIRNPRAKLTKLLLRNIDHVAHRAILSGLPNPEDPADYFAQFAFLHGHFMGYDNYWQWKHRYFHKGFTDWSWYPNKGTREKIRDYVHQHAFVLQRKTAGVGSEKIRRQVHVPMNSVQKQAMRQLRREYALAGLETKWATTVHLWSQRLAGGFHPTLDPLEMISDAKLVKLGRLCRQLKPVVVWFRFNEEIEAAYHYLIHHHPTLRVAYVHGAMKDSKRVRVVEQERFQAGRLDVILLQVKLGRYGWDLSRADTAIYYSNSYEFEDRSQSEDRLIHLTKTTPVYIIDLVTSHSTDEDVVDALSTKRITARQFGRRVRMAVEKRWTRKVA